MIKQAPYSFGISLFVLAVIVWAIFDWRHRRRLEKLEERLANGVGGNSATVKDSGNSTAIATGGSGGNAKVEFYLGSKESATRHVEPEEIPVLEFNQQDWTLLDSQNDRIHSLRREDVGSHLLSARFKNPRRGSGQKSPTAYGVHAQLTFLTKNDKQICIHYGHWIKRYEHFHDFSPGEVRELVVLLVFGNQVIYSLENHNARDPRKGRIKSGLTMLYGPKPVELADDVCAVEIALMSGDATLFERTYELARDADGAMRLVE